MPRFFWRALVLAWACGGLAAQAQAQDTAVLKRATELRDAPSDTAPSVAPLPAQSGVTRTPERKGAWVKVRTPQGASGWVHMFDLSPASGSAAGSGSAATSVARGLGSLLGGSAGQTSTATSTAGIRGLGAEDIANAQPNPAAVGRAEALRAGPEEARRFAGGAALRSRDVPQLAEPPRPAAGSGTSSSPSGGSNPSDPNFNPN
ncbi:MAG: SH3 domain-containing protein [Burkholderiaceae bacterium]